MKKNDQKISVKAIANMLQTEFIGDGSILIKDVANIPTASKGDITFAINKRYLSKAEKTDASAVITPNEIKESTKTIIISDNPRLSFAKLIDYFYITEKEKPIIHPTAVIGEHSEIGKNVAIKANAVIGENVQIGDNTVIHPNSVIADNVSVGSNCVIYSNVSVYQDTIIGDNVIIHSGTVIGSDGFGYVMDEDTGSLYKIKQIGNVIIEDDVEIGSNTSIDRAALGSTIIKKDVKIDNLVQVGHNCIIGEHTTISGQTGLSGSVELGDYVTIAGQVGIADHLKIGDKVTIAAKAGISKSLKGGKIYWGIPAREIEKVKKQKIMERRIVKYVEQIKDLNQKVKELEGKIKGNDKLNDSET